MDWYQVIKYFRNECIVSERKEVEAWINASEENRKRYNHLKEIWEAAEKTPDEIHPDFEKAWKKIQAQTGIKDRKVKQNPVKLLFKQALRIAAVLIILVGVGALIKKMYVDKPEMKTETTINTVKKEIRLDDGTTIFLNHGSRIIYPNKFKSATREVQLEGEAFFNVAKDSRHPFIVHASGTVTKVLGTSFNIKAKDSSHVMVSVLTGKVTFQPENNTSGSLRLEKGEQGLFDMNTQQLNKSVFTDENFLAWKTGILSFNNQTLGEAAKVMSEYYTKTIEVQPALQNRLITVSFDNQPLNEVLKILEITLNINIDTNSDRILLKNASNN